ncbi:MAG: hypothetical protein E6J91_44920 [Deltaproteobacteria bacterium]|nr:MAG: hypothetical protein E6J91_44920 [Deltaproteobacteria bacterium]
MAPLTSGRLDAVSSGSARSRSRSVRDATETHIPAAAPASWLTVTLSGTSTAPAVPRALSTCAVTVNATKRWSAEAIASVTGSRCTVPLTAASATWRLLLTRFSPRPSASAHGSASGMWASPGLGRLLGL